MKKYIILPFSSDLNRGDQALVWNTIKFAKEAGHNGDYFVLSSSGESLSQSEGLGIKTLHSILQHPGRKSKLSNKDYKFFLKFSWGVIAIMDLIKSKLLINRLTRFFGKMLLSKNEMETYNIIKNSEACFVKGGGFLHSAGKLTGSYTIYYSLYHIRLAQSFKKPIYILPNSFGPFNGIFVRGMIKKTLKKCEVIMSRENISHQMLNQINIKNYLCPDLGFYLQKSKNNSDEINKIKGLYPKHKLVGITVRPYRFPFSKKPNLKYDEYKASIVFLCHWLFKNGYLPVFVNHTLSTRSHESDMRAIIEITSKLGEGLYYVVSNDNFDCRDLKEVYSCFDYVIGTRFHSVIFALSEKVPSIAITYGGNKGEGIMVDMGLANYFIPIEKVFSESLILKFKLLIENEEYILGKLNDYDAVLEKEYNSIIRLLKDGVING